MGDVHHGREARGAHGGDVREVHDEIGVAEAIATLGEDDLVVATLGDLACGVLHTRGREELPLLDVHDLARACCRSDEIGLTAEEGGDLQHIYVLGSECSLLRLVDVGDDRDVEGLPYTA